MNNSTRGRLIAALVLFLVAVAGGLTAVALDRTLLRHGPPHGGPGFGPPFGPPPHEREFRDRMSRELGLSADQQQRVDSLMDRQISEIRRLRAEVQPRLDSVVLQTRREIEEILTPEQREKARAMARRGFDGHGPHGPVPGPPPGRAPY
jgi:Spy/CpxP family protein refolding chaperone